MGGDRPQETVHRAVTHRRQFSDPATQQDLEMASRIGKAIYTQSVTLISGIGKCNLHPNQVMGSHIGKAIDSQLHRLDNNGQSRR